MKVGFKINLGNYEMMSVESSEYDNGEECMKELISFLFQIDEPHVQRFLRRFQEEPEEEPPKNRRRKRQK